MLEKIARQIVLCILILIIAGIIKSVNTPATNFLSDKIKWVLLQNIELQNIYEAFDKAFSNIANSKLFKQDDASNQKSKGEEAATNSKASTVASASSGEDEFNEAAVAASTMPSSDKAGTNDDSGSIDDTGDVAQSENLQTEDNQDISSDSKVKSVSDAPKQDTSADLVNSIKKKYTFILPVSGPLGSPFGERIHPIKKTPEYHEGVDIEANSGTSIRAALGGDILEAATDASYGKYIKIKHPDGIVTLYAHCSVLSAKKGQKVKQGYVIAKVGSTGTSDGPHLHFEILKDGKPLNPLSFIKLPLK